MGFLVLGFGACVPIALGIYTTADAQCNWDECDNPRWDCERNLKNDQEQLPPTFRCARTQKLGGIRRNFAQLGSTERLVPSRQRLLWSFVFVRAHRSIMTYGNVSNHSHGSSHLSFHTICGWQWTSHLPGWVTVASRAFSIGFGQMRVPTCPRCCRPSALSNLARSTFTLRSGVRPCTWIPLVHPHPAPPAPLRSGSPCDGDIRCPKTPNKCRRGLSPRVDRFLHKNIGLVSRCKWRVAGHKSGWRGRLPGGFEIEVSARNTRDWWISAGADRESRRGQQEVPWVSLKAWGCNYPRKRPRLTLTRDGWTSDTMLFKV